MRLLAALAVLAVLLAMAIRPAQAPEAPVAVTPPSSLERSCWVREWKHDPNSKGNYYPCRFVKHEQSL